MQIESIDHDLGDRTELLSLTADIVAAYVGNNAVANGDLPSLIGTIHAELSALGTSAEPEPKLIPAVPIKKSVTPAAVICLECGKKFKMLKRHITTDHGLAPDEYRAKWGLNFDYPMVAPAYRQTRQELAIKIGLGRKPDKKPKRSNKS